MMTTVTLGTTPTSPLSAVGRTAVELSGVSKVFGHGAEAVTALADLDLAVDAGEFVCLIGASGCGKTTLLNLVAGLDEPTVGSIAVRTARPAVMFQEPALLPWLTAGRNVELPLRLSGVGRAGRREQAAELLELVRLGGLADKRPHELSGGMRQRVALARAIAATRAGGAGNPVDGSPGDGTGLLLMDEPFAAVDAITRDVLQGELTRIWRATGTSVLFVTHDVREAVRLGQRVVLLSSRPGTVLREWDVEDVEGVEGEARERLTAEIVGLLREVISTHGTA
jgi:NitT/TauT family transport system ATP-binding protein